MNITFLNGSPTHDSILDRYLEGLAGLLVVHGHVVDHIRLREEEIHYCIGCFGCWVKTPGECTVRDGSMKMGRSIINSDFTLWAAPLRMGFPSALLKKAIDKHLPLIHPYFDVVQFEAHHRARYQKYPKVGLLLEREASTDAKDLEIIADIFSRTALNFKSQLAFYRQTESPVEEIASLIETAKPQARYTERRPLLASGGQADAPHRLVIFNGSPRGRKGNTPILLSQFANGFTSISGREVQIIHLNRLNDLDQHVQAFAQAECVLLGFPLYTDAMPGLVKEFIERLEPLCQLGTNPPILFLVQSGFPEAAHSRYVQRYLERLAERLHSPYLGTMIKGGAEGVHVMPDHMTAELFDRLQKLGKGFAQSGRLDADILNQLAGRERYPVYLAPLFKLLSRTPLLRFYWDSQLKQNGAYERRFARPFAGDSG